ncbi:MAG: transketolase [Pseudomonadota bacterium]
MPSRLELANAIRALSMDAVQQANSGHPGAPMGMADIAEVLWNDFLSHNPANPDWPNRDRFVLSNGHGSMLLYSLLHLSGYDLSMEEIRNFRQLHSKTPGHPEYAEAPGVETTTGPLGQGIANAVGMALAEKILAAQFNRPGNDIIDHFTYVFTGDGCLMEGISHEVCSLAGTLKLGKMIVFYDDNGISIDGEVEGWFTDDTAKRFESYGWQVIPNIDGHNPDAISQAIETAQDETTKPTLICCRTVIGKGAPTMEGTEAVHGAALGGEEIARTRENIGWPHEPFTVPEEVYGGWNAQARGENQEADWKVQFDSYKQAYPELAADLQRRLQRKLPDNWASHTAAFIQSQAEAGEDTASRQASKKTLGVLAEVLPELLGGSADLSGSNGSQWGAAQPITGDDASGNYIHYGVREFGMSAMLNGLTLYGGFIPFGATFLTFSEYARNALRMAALMKQPSLFVYTHDSIGLGEDGPTHQSVEQLATLRLMPNMSLWRPCDTVETAVAWQQAIERTDGPACLVFSRQKLAHQQRTPEQINNIKRGAYTLLDCDGQPTLILIGTGSELELAMAAGQQLQAGGKAVRVVSMPSADVFDAQDEAYRESVLPSGVTARVAVEAGVTAYWRKYVGFQGKVIGVDSFGLSAPANVLYEHFGVTTEKVVEAAESMLGA